MPGTTDAHITPAPIVLAGLVLTGLALAGLAAAGLAGCAPAEEEPAAPTLFDRLPAERTGVTFTNTLAEGADFNILNYLYYYNGGGVAIGDVDGDDRPDLYFTANEGPNRLYLNRGGMRFEDVTEAAGVAGTAGWTTGATMADVDGDGRLDLYVSAVDHLGRRGRNQLFINQGTTGPEQPPTFADRAAAYGLDFEGYGTQATFFDYDRDGDLDCYLLNHSVHNVYSFGRASLRDRRDPRAGDRLYRNDPGPDGRPRFVDVTAEAGLYGSATGYGLSATVSDVDRDGWPDLYVGNDFHENDYLYLNNGDGTFREVIEEATGHTSQFSMGADAADVSGDGWPDLVTLDMLPDRPDVLMTSASAESYDVYHMKRKAGYHPQLGRNALQLNQGGRGFIEVGLQAGVAATDWSWAPLLADFDQDGWTDLFVANGIYRRPNDLDYINYASNEAVAADLERGVTEENLTLLQRMPQVRVANYAFRNDGLGPHDPTDALGAPPPAAHVPTFTDASAAWGLADATFSNGAAYGDLDGDGDLDLVTNNIGEAAGVYENRADSLRDGAFLRLRLRGRAPNTHGVGARVTAWVEGRPVTREHQPTRGFQSSVDPVLHLGLGPAARVDSLTVVWPGGAFQTLTGVATDQHLTLDRAEASGSYAFDAGEAAPSPLFAVVDDSLAGGVRHDENRFVDFNREPLVPHTLSEDGPALAVGDADGDGRDDLYLGGAKGQPGRLLLQRPDGTFRPAPGTGDLLFADRAAEDTDAAFFDADGDGALDLYVASGGGEAWDGDAPLADRLYLGDGRGGLRAAEGALPDLRVNTGTVAPGDYDGDGDTDLFVGGRVVALQYGAAPQSALLANDGRGRFTDVTEAAAPGLRRAGMVTDAAWADADGDGRADLWVAGEWMPLTLFRNTGTGLADVTEAAGLAGTAGWWNALAAADFDGDGDLDLVAGNLGRNTRLHATPDEPAHLFVDDFDEDGRSDPIMTVYRHGASYPVATRDELIQQSPSLKQRFPSYAAFGGARPADLFGADALDEAAQRTATTFASVYVENRGAPEPGTKQTPTFAVRPLPGYAQVAPVHALLPGDYDGDGRLDVLLGGNRYGVKPAQGRYDASRGLLLRGDGRGGFVPVPPHHSGLWLDGEIRALARIGSTTPAPLIVAARNGAPLAFVRVLLTAAPRAAHR